MLDDVRDGSMVLIFTSGSRRPPCWTGRIERHDPAFERFEHIWTFEPAAEGDMVQGRRR
jgi:hypothetical protein